jgi:hypothetical protein
VKRKRSGGSGPPSIHRPPPYDPEDRYDQASRYIIASFPKPPADPEKDAARDDEEAMLRRERFLDQPWRKGARNAGRV